MGEPCSVLIVDDEDDIRDGVTRWLEASGCRVTTARDGVAGVASALSTRPDAILLDVLMPGMDGMQTMARLKADERTSKTPVVMLSASLRDEQRALDAGARYFVHKPYNGKELVSTVKVAVAETDALSRT